MVTPASGSMIWQGLSTGKRYNMSIYISDVVAADITFSQDGAPGTTTPNFWIAPEDVQLVDFALPSGPTVMVGLKFKVNDAPVGQQMLIANHLNTLATRPIPGFGAKSGKKITFTQF